MTALLFPLLSGLSPLCISAVHRRPQKSPASLFLPPSSAQCPFFPLPGLPLLPFFVPPLSKPFSCVVRSSCMNARLLLVAKKIFQVKCTLFYVGTVREAGEGREGIGFGTDGRSVVAIRRTLPFSQFGKSEALFHLRLTLQREWNRLSPSLPLSQIPIPGPPPFPIPREMCLTSYKRGG